MPQPNRSRRTLLPLTLLLGGLLGAGPFVPRTLGAVAANAGPAPVDVPGLAGWLGLALAVAALAGVVIARREADRTREPRAADRRPDDPAGDGDGSRSVDPLLAALRGPAAYAPDDLDARLTASASSTAAHPVRPESAPLWVRRIAPTRPGARPEPSRPEPSWPDDDPADRPAETRHEASRA